MMPEKEHLEIHEVYIRHRTELCRYVINKVNVSSDEAQDIVQTAFARVIEMEFSEIKNPRALLYRTSYNIAIDQKRHSGVRQRHIQAVVDTDAKVVEELSPARIHDGRRQLTIVAKALWDMPKKRRKLLVMNRFDGLSYAEIARRVDLSETVVRKHVTKALIDCQKALQAQAGKNSK
jgi:RNA polymerase sigma-70 factor (ECF subfamily)